MKYGTKFGLFQILTHWYQFCSNWKCLFNRNSIIEFYIARNFHGSPDRFDRWNLILQTVRWITRKYLFCPNWLWLESNKILEIRPKSRDYPPEMANEGWKIECREILRIHPGYSNYENFEFVSKSSRKQFSEFLI